MTPRGGKPMENLASVDWQLVGSGIAVVIVGLLAKVGQMAAKSSPPKDDARLEVAAALIDGRDARALTESIDGMTGALAAHAKAMQDFAARQDKNTNASEDLRDEARELRRCLDNLGASFTALDKAISISNAQHR